MPEFDWDNANIAHIAAHGATMIEAERVIQNDPYDLEELEAEGELISQLYQGDLNGRTETPQNASLCE